MIRLAIFATHPVQYHVAIWRTLAAMPGMSVTVFYFNDMSVRGGIDPGFGIPVVWDVPLLDGYDYTFISRNADLSRPHRVGISNPDKVLKEGQFNWVLIQGYMHRFERQLVCSGKRDKIKVIMRGEFADIGRKSFIKSFARQIYLRWFYSHVDRFCFIGEMARRHLISCGIPQDRLFFSPYAVDSFLFEKLSRTNSKEKSRESLGFPAGYFVFLFSGKLIPRKEPLLLLEALSHLTELHSIAVIMLGDGELREKVWKRGSMLLGKRFIAPGFVNQSELGMYFAAADALVLPSSYETWGLVVNEAMYFSLPVIVSDRVGCQPDLVIPGKTGYVFASGDSESLSKVLSKLINEKENTRIMGKNAREMVARYGVAQAVDGIIKALSLTEN